MAIKDLSAYLQPSLEIAWQDRVFVIHPPSKDVGLKLAAINAAGIATYLSISDACPTCGRAGAPDELPQETQDIVAALRNVDLGELSLGKAYQEMIEEEVPGPHVDRFALYAMYYWVIGEESADALMDTVYGGGASGGAQTPRSGSSTSKPGQPTGSGNRTQRRASSRGTGASRKR